MTTLDDRITSLAARQHGLVALQQLYALGVSKAAIRHRRENGRLLPLLTGVLLVAGAPQSPMTRILGAVLAAGPDALASHRTAAFVFGLPGFSEQPIDITVPFGRRPRVR